jgi:Ca-activated chloride channel family protein
MNRVLFVLPFAILSLAARPQESVKPDPVEPVLRIILPTSESLLIGDTAFKAQVLPEETPVSSVEFLVDGSIVCKIEKRPFECIYQAGEAIAAHTVRAVANLANGERLVATVRTSGGITETSDVRAVNFAAVVTDYLDRVRKTLTKESFRVFEDGVPQTVEGFKAVDHVPLDVVIAIDTSGSMAPSMPKLKSAVKKFLAKLSALNGEKTPVKVTVLGFNDRTYMVSKPVDDPTTRAAAVDSLKSFGGTALYDSILQAAELVGKEEFTNKAIIVFTDGDDRSSLASTEAVEKQIRESYITLYMITQGLETQMEAVRRIVNRFSQISGGRAFPMEKIDELGKAFDSILDDLTHQYLIGYTSTNQAQDGTYRKIVVKTTSNSDRVRARDGYRAPLQ